MDTAHKKEGKKKDDEQTLVKNKGIEEIFKRTTSPVRQISGLCTFWQCWVETPGSPKNE